MRTFNQFKIHPVSILRHLHQRQIVLRTAELSIGLFIRVAVVVAPNIFNNAVAIQTN